MRLCHFFLRREGVLGIGHLIVFCFPMYSYAIDYIGVSAREVISNLMNLLGPDIFSKSGMKGQVL